VLLRKTARLVKLPTSHWAASSQLLDVTAFPQGPAERQGKNREKESGAKPREGLRRRCRRRHGSFNES
jgi:hypothetical protein